MAYSKNRRLAEIVSDTSGNLSVEGIIVPTQSSSDNDTSAASTAFVHAHIDAVLDSAPGTLNTLNEIAAALNDDANFNTTVTNAIAAKLPLAGGTMTGALTSNSLIKTTGAVEIASAQPRLLLDRGDGSYSWNIYNGGGTDFPLSSFNIANNADTAIITALDNGNVGIGDTSPDQKLHVNSGASNVVAKFESTDSIAAIQFKDNNGEAEIGAIGNDIGFYPAGAEKVRITNSGRVGIGETSPDKQLHIKNTATGDTGIVIENTNNAQNLDIDFYNNGGAAQGRIRYAEGAGSFGFAPNVSATDALHILYDGKVGIGTTSPAHPLSVRAVNAKITAESTADSQTIGFHAKYQDHATLYGSLEYTTGDAQLYIDNNFPGNNGVYGDINFRNKDNAGSSLVSRMKIKGSTGNVGINTTDPKQLLQVKETSTTNQVHYPVTIGGSSHVAGYAVGIGIDPEGYGDRNKVAIVVEGRNNGYSRGLMHFLMDKTDDSSSATIADSKMVIHEDGYVGIGTTAPSTRLHVYSNTSGVIATISGPNSYNSETGISLAVDRAKISGVLNGSGGSPGASLRFHTQPDSGSLTERMRINSTGQVLAQAHGVSTPSFSFIGDNNTGMTRPTGDTLQFVTGGSERMRINSSDVMIGKNTSDINTQGFHVINSGTYTGAVYSGVTGSTANSTYHVRDTTNNTWKFYVTHAGVINATSTSIAGLSDERLKENIKDLETGLTEVMALKPRRFDWKEGEGSNKKNVAGFVAQEVETVLPDVIEGFMHDDLDNPKSVRMGDMLPTLVKAIQELKTKLEAAEARITTLEG